MKTIYERFRGWRALPWALGMALLLSVALLTGCSNNVTAPDQTTLDQTEQDPVALAFATYKRPDFSDDLCSEASGIITPQRGGRINLNWGHPSNRFVVGRGAVDQKVKVTISSCLIGGDKDNLDFVEFDFGPDGLEFNKPAKLILNARDLVKLKSRYGLNNIYKLYWLNPETGEWEVYSEAVCVHGRIIFEIEHFSKFGISRM